jgi:hypothetical protein
MARRLVGFGFRRLHMLTLARPCRRFSHLYLSVISPSHL